MAQTLFMQSVARIPLAGLLAWLLPGAGHVFVGDRKRGIIIGLTIALTFWGGIAIGGVRTTVDPDRKKLWFMAQICNGSHAIAAYTWGTRERTRLIEEHQAQQPAYGRRQAVSGHDELEQLKEKLFAHSRWNSAEVGVVYTGVAGLLSLLAIMDALVRADWASRRPSGPDSARTQARPT